MANIIEKAKARLKEARGSAYTLYHKSYTDAINHALSHHQKSGLNVSDDDRFQHVGVGSKKPSEGNTTSVSMPATHTSGKKHMVHVQVFNKGGTHPYELNTYSSGMGRNVKEAADNYPREGFPKEGDYGYHSNPGLKPQESDSDEDMDKAYKAANGEEAKKPLNAKTTEVSNKIEEGRGEDSKGHYRATEDGAGLTRKGAKAMGIKTAVTTPPSKLDPKGEAAGRRKSFCARMGGMKGPMKDEKGRPTRKAMSLRRWNCNEEIEQINEYGIDQNAHSVSNGYTPKTPPKRPPIAKPTMHPAAEKPRTPQSSVGSLSRIRAGMAKRLNNSTVKEELGKEDEWGSPELRKKWAAMTPGQEGLAADKIPAMNPFSGDAIQEQQLDEISALGAKKRSEFAAKLRKTLADPKKIAKAKKDIAKKKAVQRAEEPKHLVMQLRKATSIGSKVKFYDGAEHHVAPNHVEKFNDRYHSLKSSIEKEALQKRAHKSHTEFMRTIAESVHENCGTPDCCQMCDTAEMGTHHVDSYEAHKGSGDQISPVISHDDEDIRFQDFDEEAFEKELEADVLALSWDDLVDLYDEDEIEYDESPDEEGEELEEGITPAGRLKKKFNAMRSKSRRMMARNIAIKRVSSPEKLKSRSIRAARRMVYKRLLRNRDISTVSSSEKTRLEAQIKRMAPMVARLSVRVMPAVRKLEQSRIKNSRTRKKK